MEKLNARPVSIFRTVHCGIAWLLLGCAICGAQQSPQVAPPAEQVPTAPEPVNSAEMEAFAAMIAAKINKGSSVVVVGGADPEKKMTNLGAALRDGLNDALVRQPAGLRVISTTDVTEILKRNRVSAGMIYCNLLSEWIAAYSQADITVALRVERAENGHAVVTTQIFDAHQKIAFDKKTNDIVPLAKFRREINLTDAQARSFDVEYHATLKRAAPSGGTNGLSVAKCLHCPYTRPYPEQARQLRIQGTVYLSVTVLPDGTADDISVDRPVGGGLDGASINTILAWKFAPSVDSQGNPVATRVPIQNAFTLRVFPSTSSPHEDVQTRTSGP